MARTANMSVLGLYTWDNTLFSLMEIPDELDKDTLIDNLLAETAELETLYANPVVLKNLIAVWSQKELPIWNKLYETTQYEYNPIDNYNRIEEGTESGTDSRTHSGSDIRTLGGTDTSSGSYTDGHWVAGFDSTPSGNNDGLVKQHRNEGNSSATTNYGKTDTLAHGESVASQRAGGHTLHAHGNIGVTTTQKLIREEREIDRFNVYDIIIESFKMRFCIMVY